MVRRVCACIERQAFCRDEYAMKLCGADQPDVGDPVAAGDACSACTVCAACQPIRLSGEITMLCCWLTVQHQIQIVPKQIRAPAGSASLLPSC